MIFPNLDKLTLRQLSDRVAHAYYGRPCKSCLYLDWPTAGTLIYHFRITLVPMTWEALDGSQIDGWSAHIGNNTDPDTMLVLDPDPIRAIGKAIVYNHIQGEHDGL